MRPVFICFLFLASLTHLQAQDTVYARQVIKFLTSEKCFGRGYVKNGLSTAANYIAKELKDQAVTPLFKNSYFQEFTFDVNTFPGKMRVEINKKLLKPGIDYIVDPACGSLKGTFTLVKKDSLSYYTQDKNNLVFDLKKKLTYSVATDVKNACIVQLLNNASYGDAFTAKVNIENKFKPGFVNNNVCGFIPGTKNNDSMIVFSAHYDHLGGMGKHTFFPGANDNASGVSVLLNLVRYYKTHPPAYKTLFLFFAGEEAGLIGSKHFIESKAIDLRNIKFLVNLDLLGTGNDGIMVVNGAIHQKEFELLTKINVEKNRVKEIKKRGKASNSDHYWFTEAGVPCFFIYTIGGVTAYHDVLDIEKTLPLTDYVDVFLLITEFAAQL